jgi:phenylalanyl-tRNA synthetase beta chain
MRHSLLASLLEVAERNARTVDRLAIFEIGPVFLGTTGGLPQEAPQLGLLLGGARTPAGWQPSDRGPLDFYDLKGIVLGMLDRLHLPPVRFEPTEHPSFHPGKCAAVHLDELELGVLGELHPLVQRQYDLGDRNVLAALFSLEALLAQAQERYVVRSVATFPPVLEDLAVIVREEMAAGQVETLIRQTGGKLVSEVRLFDVYRSETLGAGQKSLAYSLTYLAPDRTLTDKEVTTLRQRIIRRLENELGARIRTA